LRGCSTGQRNDELNNVPFAAARAVQPHITSPDVLVGNEQTKQTVWPHRKQTIMGVREAGLMDPNGVRRCIRGAGSRKEPLAIAFTYPNNPEHTHPAENNGFQ
jgi:hypothetical protein